VSEYCSRLDAVSCTVLRTIRALTGVTLIAAGVVLFVDKLGGVTKAGEFASRWWPLAIVALAIANGLSFLGPPFRGATSRALPLASVLAVLLTGTILLLDTTGKLPNAVSRLFPAGALVVVGALIATIHRSPDRRYQTWVATSALLRRVRFSSSGRSLKLISVRAVLGEVALDLTRSTLDVAGAEIHATVVGGSISLRLPAGWEVAPHVVADESLQFIQLPVDPGLPKVSSRVLPVRLTGISGQLSVEWAAAPANLLTESN
jgi:hypothetical protein